MSSKQLAAGKSHRHGFTGETQGVASGRCCGGASATRPGFRPHLGSHTRRPIRILSPVTVVKPPLILPGKAGVGFDEGPEAAIGTALQSGMNATA